MNWQDWVILAALALNLAALAWLVARQRADYPYRLMEQALAASNERLERELRDEVARSSSGTRQEIGQALAVFQQTLLAQSGDVARTHTAQAQSAREAQDLALKRFSDALNEQLRAMSEANERRIGEVRATVEQRLTALQQGNEQKL